MSLPAVRPESRRSSTTSGSLSENESSAPLRCSQPAPLASTSSGGTGASAEPRLTDLLPDLDHTCSVTHGSMSGSRPTYLPGSESPLPTAPPVRCTSSASRCLDAACTAAPAEIRPPARPLTGPAPAAVPLVPAAPSSLPPVSAAPDELPLALVAATPLLGSGLPTATLLALAAACRVAAGLTSVSASLSCTPSVSVIILYSKCQCQYPVPQVSVSLSCTPSVSVIILYPKCQCHYPVPQVAVVSAIILYPKCQCHYPVPQVSVSFSCTPSASVIILYPKFCYQDLKTRE
ncbi:unnamed protein product [Ranitomeya imitator]|uniref:Uncharacterized protein n=1 Tax=Ranitomeya imitator TaxID=111125 RepID=A0ABN9MMV2_9NEOB|nr:unnamed protein product [Ranitomeya imitator]